MNRRGHGAVLLGVVLLALVLRAVWPLADPPGRLSWSQGVLTDPAAVIHAARSASLHGTWERTRDLLFYPAMNGLTWCAFAVFGATRLTTQGLAALLGTLAVVGFAGAAAHGRGGSARVLALWLLGTSFWLGMFARVPLVENLTCALLGAAAWAGRKGGRGFVVALALATGATLFGKAHAAPFAVALLAYRWARERSLRAVLPGLGAAAAVAIVWAVAIFLPNREAMLDQMTRLGENLGAGSPLLSPLRTLRTSWIFHRMPVLGIVGTVFLVQTALSPSVRRRRLDDGTALFAFAFFAFWIYSSFLPYQAPRYYIPAVFAWVGGAAVLIHEWWEGGTRPDERDRSGRWVWMGVVFLTVLGALEATVHYATAWDEATRVRVFRPSGLAAVLFRWLHSFERNAGIALGVAALSGLGWARRPAPGWIPRRRLAATVVLAATFVAGGQWVYWATHRTYSWEDARRSVAAILAPDARLFGTYAPGLVLGTGRDATPAFGRETRRQWEESGATHVVLDAAAGDAFWTELEAAHPGSVVALGSWRLNHPKVGAVRMARVAGTGEAVAWSEFELATRELDAGDPEAAVARLVSHGHVAADVPDFLRLEGQARFAAGDAAGARACLERAVAMRPSVEELYRLGHLALSDGDRPAARAHWLRAIRLDPFDERIRLALEGLRGS